MRDFMDDERDRRLEDMSRRSRYDGGSDDLVEWLLGIVGIFLVILVIAGFLDSQFGWGLTDWIWGLIGRN